MSSKIDITDADVTIIISKNNQLYLVKMNKEKYEAITALTKASIEEVIVTNKTVNDLYEFVGLGE